MTIDEAKSRLLNTAWLGTDEDRDKTEEAVGVLFDAVKVIEDIKQEIIQERDGDMGGDESMIDSFKYGCNMALDIINKHIGEVRE